MYVNVEDWRGRVLCRDC